MTGETQKPDSSEGQGGAEEGADANNPNFNLTPPAAAEAQESEKGPIASGERPPQVLKLP